MPFIISYIHAKFQKLMSIFVIDAKIAQVDKKKLKVM